MLLLRHGEGRTMTDKVGCHLPGIYRFPYKKNGEGNGQEAMNHGNQGNHGNHENQGNHGNHRNHENHGNHRNQRNSDSVSKFISLILRHHPETVGITLDEHGWANVEALIEGVQRTRSFDRKMLEEIVDTDEKQRYSFNEDKTLIRANQGHSIPVDVELQVLEPPEYLYHGTGQKYVESIGRSGLLPKGRLYVHLSGDVDMASKVGSRHGKPVVYRVNSKRMRRDGHVFYRSVNGVWLVKAVPVEYLETIPDCSALCAPASSLRCGRR